MKKLIDTPIIMIVSLIIGIIAYGYIMVFIDPGVLPVSALIFFSLLIRFTSGYCLDKKYRGVTILDYINEQYKGFLKILDLLYPLVITLLIYYRMNR